MHLSYWCTQLAVELWTMSGTSSARSVIDIKATSENHRALLRSVPPVHILSSCHTVSRLHGIGKGKAPEDDGQLKLANLNIPIDQVIEEASKCVQDFHRTRETNMSAARYDIWTSKLTKQNTNQLLYWRCYHSPLRHLIYMFDILLSKPRSGGHHSNQILLHSVLSIWMDIGLVNKSYALSFTACWCVTCTIRWLKLIGWLQFMWCGCSSERPMMHASPVPCFVAVMQTTTVTTNTP